MDRERERVLSAYQRLRVHHPALPPNLRDFQVVFHMKRGNLGGEFFFEQVDPAVEVVLLSCISWVITTQKA